MRKIKLGDNVKVISGKAKGQEGKVLAVRVKDGKFRVVVEGVNKAKIHKKPNQALGINGGIIEIERFIDASNVLPLIGGKPERVKFSEVKGKKVRVGKKSNKQI
jgi:large subunit ribosomal protein L24